MCKLDLCKLNLSFISIVSLQWSSLKRLLLEFVKIEHLPLDQKI